MCRWYFIAKHNSKYEKRIKQDIVSVECSEESVFDEVSSTFNNRYNKRDIASRKNMYDLINSDENKVTNVFSTLFER